MITPASGNWGRLVPGDRKSLGAALHAARHAVSPVGGGESSNPVNEGTRYFAVNPGQRLSFRFLDGAVRIGPSRGGVWQGTLRLVSPLPNSAGPTVPSGAGDRVEYQHPGGLTEWYENRSDGIEHGMILRERPARAPGSDAVRIELELLGLTARRESVAEKPNTDGATLELVDQETGAAVLRYGGLRVWDAEHRPLPARLEAQGSLLAVVVEDRDALYPVTIDPVITSLEAELNRQGSGAGGADDLFGAAVSLSDDGTMALVGASQADLAAGRDAGIALVFVRRGGEWTLQAELRADAPAGWDYFGCAVSLAGDGKTALVGVYGRDPQSGWDEAGGAYVFVRSGSVWSQQATLSASDRMPYDHFGRSVSLSGDGNTALIGAPQDDTVSFADVGSAYIFSRTGASWSQQTKLNASDGVGGDSFGTSVSISIDGNRALVGTPSDDAPPGWNQGSAYVFARSGGVWTLEAKLTASDGTNNDQFGSAVCLSANGATAVIGAPYDYSATGDYYAGSAYVFAWTGTAWEQQVKLTATDAASGDQLGASVSVSGDGNLVIAGARGDEVGEGSAYVFSRSGGTWTQQTKLTDGDGPNTDEFGSAVVVSRDGLTLLAGAPRHATAAGPDAGTAMVFVWTDTGWSSPTSLTGGDGVMWDSFGSAVSLSDDGQTALVGASGAATAMGAGAGVGYVFVRSGNSWALQAQLLPWDAAGSLGTSASLSADGNTALLGAPYADSFQGAAYIFVRSGSVWSGQAKLTANDGASGDRFGWSVSLAADGNTAVIGADGDTTLAGSAAGSVTVFGRSGGAWSQQARLTASDAAAGDRFGWSVSLSGDGSTVLVGAANDDTSSGADSGSAYVFVGGGSSWSQQRQLLISGAAYDYFGFSVSLSQDGNRALVGAPGATSWPTAVRGGSVIMFVRSGGSWSLWGGLSTADQAAGDNYGCALSLSRDGNTAVIGASRDDTAPGWDQGCAYVLAWTGSTWSLLSKLTAHDATTNDLFGAAVGLSGDGNTALVGAFLDDSTVEADAGSAYVFARAGGFSQQVKLTANETPDLDRLGIAVSLSYDGDRALVGAYGEDTLAGPGRGTAYVFVRSAGAWTLEAKLTASNGAMWDRFGRSVALSSDGNTAVVGAPQRDAAAGPDAGSAYVYVRSGGVWSEQAELTALWAGANDYFGQSVSISSDGNTVLVGLSVTMLMPGARTCSFAPA